MHRLPYIFFDAAGTLFSLKEPVGAGYARIAAGYGFELDPAATDTAFRTEFATAEHPSYATRSSNGPDSNEESDRLWWKDFVARVFRQAGVDPHRSTFSECFEALFKFYGQAEAWRLFPETNAALDRLKEHGFEIGVLSNFDQRLHGILDALDIRHQFAHVVISSELGAAKPNPKLFHAAAATIGRDAGGLHPGRR